MRGEIIWYKQNMTKLTAWGSWLSANKPSLRDSHEYILVFRKEGDRKGISDITKEEFIKFTQALWHVSAETDNPNHPAPYPEELIYRIIKLYSFKNETVYDPFLGSGTTSAVAKKLGRNSIGIELNPTYIKMAQDRLNRIIGQEQTISKIQNTIEI